MKRFMMAAVAAASLLTACGGGDSGTDRVTAVKVVGASLADSGTFGFKFTVQAAGSTKYQVYPERVAQAYNLPALCSGFLYDYDAEAFTSQPGCTNLAVAGAGINYGVFTDSPSDGDTVKETFTAFPVAPSSQLYQLETLGVRGFAWGDLLIVGEGSANDTATLVTAYLNDAQNAAKGTPTTLFAQVINSLLTNGSTVLAQGAPAAGTVYMQKLAEKLVASVRTNAIQKGARRVLILNTLDVTRTPRFEAVLAGIAASQGQPQADAVRGLVQAWISAYNSALSQEVLQLSGRVVVADVYTAFNAQLAQPSAYGLTNITGTVCDETYAKVTSSGTPRSLFTAGETSLNTPEVVQACTDSNASKTTPSADNTGTTWWTTYLFADNFHPTPRGHELLANVVTQRLRAAGWL